MRRRRDVGVGQHCHSTQSRHRLDQDLLSLAIEFRREKADPSSVASRASQRGYKPFANHVFSHADEGYRPGRLLQRACLKLWAANDCVRLSTYHRRGPFREVIIFHAKTVGDHDKVSPFDEAAPPQLIEESDHCRRISRTRRPSKCCTAIWTPHQVCISNTLNEHNFLPLTLRQRTCPSREREDGSVPKPLRPQGTATR